MGEFPGRLTEEDGDDISSEEEEERSLLTKAKPITESGMAAIIDWAENSFDVMTESENECHGGGILSLRVGLG